MRTSCRLIIFEGPDGAGKTWQAKKMAEGLNARYVHMGPFRSVGQGLPRFFVDAIMPAVLGHQSVILDRCWLSEKPYGTVFRSGQNRVDSLACRQLERLAMRCETSVVLALPPRATSLENFSMRKEQEYLDLPEQLSAVYSLYESSFNTDLPLATYDYTSRRFPGLNSTIPHPVDWPTAGNLSATVLLVGESFADHRDCDPLYQWPFGSLSGQGCSRWLTEQLHLGGISERDLCWINADAIHSDQLHFLDSFDHVFALGSKASDRLDTLKTKHMHVQHPQAWKRFHSSELYPLIAHLQEALKC